MHLPALYPILDLATLEHRRVAPVEAAEALLEAGAGILQFRCKGHYTRAILSQAEDIANLCHQAGARYVINDRADVAMLLDAAVHVGQDDLAPADVRRLVGPSRVIGFSTHNEAQLKAAAHDPADYLALGPIFNTGSKANPDPVVGLEELRRLRPLAGDRPLVAIGGITLENAPAVYAAGADSIALIGALFHGDCTRPAIRTRAAEWLAINRSTSLS